MIAICEPICRDFSHEKVNSGFLYGLRLAFPDDNIRFYADNSHINAIQAILAHDKVEIENIEYVPIALSDPRTLNGAFHYYKLFKRIFCDIRMLGTDKVFFFSYSPVLIYLIKKLKQTSKFADLKFTFVLHGDFESITGQSAMLNPLITIRDNDKVRTTFSKKIAKLKPLDITKIVYRRVKNFIQRILSISFQIYISKWFPTKKILLWKHSPDFKYIALSEHVIENAKKYIDTDKLAIHTVVLPTNFATLKPAPENKHVKFAIFGYGNSAVLREIAYQLDKKEIKRAYEIRIIGMDNTGLAEYPNISCPSQGKPLERKDMEKYAQDIDAFMILYHKEQYRLTCSGTILEALSNSKPILHFDNDCINFFNKPDRPIGFCCNTMEEYVERMEDIITNYENYSTQFQSFRHNIIDLREKLSVKNSVYRIKESFMWKQ